MKSLIHRGNIVESNKIDRGRGEWEVGTGKMALDGLDY